MPLLTVHSKKYGNRTTEVDEVDYATLSKYRWSLHARKYIARMTKDRIKVFLQREILKPNPGEIIRNKDGNRMNNRRDNLCVQKLNRSQGIRK